MSGLMTLEEKLKHYGLSKDEYAMACSILGQGKGHQEPTPIEWALFSALWSEHCSYKSSKNHLKNLYSKSKIVVSNDGENAGVVDLGQGERVAFKMESHNHPSFIEPFQGAATGVGGILRDIFTMGARPMALANYICFGESGSKRLQALVEGVVSGISFYANCVGVSNISGQTEFNKTYNTNNLVNAFALGYYGKDDKIISSKIKNPGSQVVYVGAKTGKDGVHGASMASESFDEGGEAKRPTVQIGDPFYEKCLIESCLEVMKKNLVESVQDMGAAGITSASFEMSVGGGLGLDLNLSKIPLRDQNMSPEEILLSESQERMLMTVSKENIKKVEEIFSKWGLDAVVIGEVRKEKKIKIYWKNELVCQVSPFDIINKAPRYNRPHHKLKWLSTKGESKLLDLKEVFSSPQGCSRKWIYNQYDQRVGAKTVSDCLSPIGIIRLPESGRPLGVALGCRPLLMDLSPILGGKDSILSPAIQLSLKGFRPWAVTDCLNFGNPQKENIMSEFTNSLKAMSEACQIFKTPIISGNVSLYNETQGENITSTPATCVVGLRDQKLTDLDNRLPKSKFIHSGSKVIMIECGNFTWSGYSGDLKKQKPWGSGDLNITLIKTFCDYLYDLSFNGDIKSSRLVGKFGPQYALSQMINEGIGFKLNSSILNKFLKTERFYQVILEIDKNFKLPKSSFKVVDLGETNETGVFEYLDKKLSLKEINKLQCTGWEKHFGN